MVFDGEKKLLKGVYQMKKELLDKNKWEITEKNSKTQPSLIQNDLIDGKITNDTLWEKCK